MVSDASRNLMGASCELFGTGRKENPNMRETMEKMRKKTLKSPAISLFTTIKSEDNLPFFCLYLPSPEPARPGPQLFRVLRQLLIIPTAGSGEEKKQILRRGRKNFICFLDRFFFFNLL